MLLFILILVVLAWISYFFYDFRQRRNWQPPSVAVAQTEEEAKKSVVLEVNFLGQTSGIYVFGLMRRVVVDEQALRRYSAHLGSDEGPDSGQMVNVVFTRGDQPMRKLLPKDGLVLLRHLFDETDSKKIKASLFTCVTEDTDGNRRLDEKDRQDLYVLAPSLDRPDIVVNGVISWDRAASPTHIVVKTEPAPTPTSGTSASKPRRRKKYPGNKVAKFGMPPTSYPHIRRDSRLTPIAIPV